MKKIFTPLFITALVVLTAHADEVTLNFADLGLDNSAKITDHVINDNLTITSGGNTQWNESNGNYRLFTTTYPYGSLTVTISNATLTGVTINCTGGYEFGGSTLVMADSQNQSLTVNPFSWTGEATETFEIEAASNYGKNYVAIESITFSFTPKATSSTQVAEVLCKDMNVSDQTSLPADGYDIDSYVNVNFVQGTHTATPTYRASVNGFYVFNGQQIVITPKNGATLQKIEITTTDNAFGYSGTVTADGVQQTYQTDFEWVPFWWKGSAERNVVVENGGRTGNTQVTGIKVTYLTPGEGVQVSKPVITPSETDNTVTISCDTPEAVIYYTLDGTQPTTEDGTQYDAPFTITQRCTVKAVAVLQNSSSSVAELEVYLNEVANLADFRTNNSPKAVKINTAITAVVTGDKYLLVKDAQGHFGIAYSTTGEFDDDLNVENGTTWSYIVAKPNNYGGHIYVDPTSFGEKSTGETVEPTEMKTTDGVDDHKDFEYVVVKNVKVMSDPGYFNYWILTDENGNEFENGYKKFNSVTPPADDETARYDVTGIVSPEDEDEPGYYELWFTGFDKKETTGIQTIKGAASHSDAENVYFNLNGIRLDNPAKGTVIIKVNNGQAEKIIAR